MLKDQLHNRLLKAFNNFLTRNKKYANKIDLAISNIARKHQIEKDGLYHLLISKGSTLKGSDNDIFYIAVGILDFHDLLPGPGWFEGSVTRTEGAALEALKAWLVKHSPVETTSDLYLSLEPLIGELSKEFPSLNHNDITMYAVNALLDDLEENPMKYPGADFMSLYLIDSIF